MAERITIDYELRLQDHVTPAINQMAGGMDKAGKSIDATQKRIDKFGKSKASAMLDAQDRASSKVEKVLSKASKLKNSFVSKLEAIDNASSTLSKISRGVNGLAGKTFKAAFKVVDYATAPLRKIRDMIFNIKTLIAGVVAGAAAKKFVLDPISLADQYSGAKIGFSTLLGDTEGQKMMDKIDAFAKATPFKTSNTIASVQKMMAYGWDVNRVIDDMKIIGDAAAATGKGDQGLESIVYALSEIRSKGKLSTQELNQLASAGIKAKGYLAQGLGYGTSDEGMAKLAKDLEKGVIGANQAIEMILEGMKEFDGMMDRTANETVEGLKSQLEDTFEINIARKWGQGLQDGAKRGLGSIVKLLDSAEKSLENFGSMIYEVGKSISGFAADKLEKAITTINEITGTDTFKNASLKEKFKMLWKGVITDPLSEWWEGGGREKTVKKAEEIGAWTGRTLTNALLGILGITDIFAEGGIDGSEGKSIGQAFAQGFVDNFNVDAITDKVVVAIKNVWGALPTWAKVLVGSYGAGKVFGGIGTVAGGTANFINGASKFFGSAAAGTGLLGLGANTAITLGAGNLAGGASIGALGLSALGLGGIAGGAVGLTAVGKGFYDFYKANQAEKEGNATEVKARSASGASAIGGVGAGALAGAAIGSLFTPIGTAIGGLIGAGIGGVAGLIGGSKWAKNIRAEAEAAKYETEAMKNAVKDTELSAEELALQFERAVNSNIADHFGDIELSMEEIQSIASRLAFGDAANQISTFTRATETAAASLKSMQSSAETLDRLNWKVGLGIKLDEKEIEEYRSAIDNYIYNAQKYVEDKHYEFTAAVTLLMDVTQGDGKSILESGNAFYGQLKSQLDGLGSQLSKSVNIALEDGVITLDEQAEILNLQNQMAEITNKLAQAETEAKFEAIKIKFGGANLTDDSFAALQAELQKQLDESTGSYENALTASLTNLRLQYNEGLIDEAEYERLRGVLEAAFNSQLDELNVKVQQVQIEIIAEAYQDVLGEDAAARLSSAIETSLKEGISPATWTTEDVRRFLNAPQLSEETAGAIAKLLAGMEFETEPSVEVKPNYTLKNPWEPEEVNTTQNANVGIQASYTLNNPWSPSSSLFNRTLYPTITMLPQYVDANGAPYVHNANGSIIGSKTLTWVGEEGPEAIIPLVPGRRARGLKLWEEAGRQLGVQYHAEGGIVGGDTAPIVPYNGKISSDGEQNIEINMGGVTIEIKADSSKSMAQNIEDQEEEIAKKVAQIFNKVFSAQFANRPARGEA